MVHKIKRSLSLIDYKLIIALMLIQLVPTLTGIALMFGIGMAFDSLVSLVAYRYLLKKNKINFLT